MVLFFWRRPSSQDQQACILQSGTFNYDSKHRGASSKPLSSLQHLSGEGYFVNHGRVLLGSGESTFETAKAALRLWRHFSLDWAFVDPETPIKTGAKFCVCVKEILPWVTLPLQVAYVSDNNGGSRISKRKASFGFGSGTLSGHLLAGEERFAVEWDENNEVWYEVVSFSKPAHLLSFLGYPYVQLRQKYFARQSMNSILKHVKSASSPQSSG